MRYKQLFNNDGWETGTAETPVASFIKAFMDEMKTLLGLNGESFGNVEHIQMLLHMMDWAASDSRQNNPEYRYMTIEPNQFKEHPVLPDPLHIPGDVVAETNASRTVAPSVPQLMPQNHPTPKERKLLPDAGDEIKGKLQEILADGAIYLIIDGYPDHVEGYISAEEIAASGKNYSQGFPANSIKLKVQEVRPQGDRFAVICQFIARNKK